MADKTSSYIIAFDGDAGNLNQVLAGLKATFKSTVSDLQSTAARVDLFANVEANVRKASDAFFAARANADFLRQAIDKVTLSGEKVSSELAADFKRAELAVAAASKAYNDQASKLDALRLKLTAAGVSTANLAAEQARLAAELKAASAAAAEQSAKSLLGFKSLADVQPQITALQKSFDTLKASGKLSATEIAAAQGLLQEKIAAVKGEVTGLGTAFKTQGGAITGFLSSSAAQLLGFAAAIGTAVSAIHSVTEEANKFNLAITQIGTISDASKEQLDTLAAGARELARVMGFDVVEAVHAVYDTVRSGISTDNALKVLEVSADAAKASLIDIGTASKLSSTLVKSFDVQIEDLSKTIDVLFQGMKDGGPTLAELASGLGALGPIAKATNTPIEDLAAALQVMTKAGLDAPTAIADLNKVLVKLNTGEAKQKLHDLGIEFTSFRDAVNQLAERGLGLDQLGDLGLASTKSATAITSLTNSTKGLNDEIARLKDSAGATAKAVEALDQTPQERFERFAAAVKDLSITFGTAVTGSSKLLVGLTNLINSFNNLAPSVKNAVAQTALLNTATVLTGGAFGPLTTLLTGFDIAVEKFSTNQTKAAISLKQFSDQAVAGSTALQQAVTSINTTVQTQLGAVNKNIDTARQSLTGFVADIEKVITQSQSGANAALADLNTRAQAQLAALDKSAAAERASAEEALKIQTKLAADRLKVISQNAADILKAFDAEAQARIAIAQRAGQSEQKIAFDIAQARIAVLSGIKAALESQYADALKGQQAFVDRLNAIDRTRVTFNEQIANDLRAIRNEGLSDFDKYQDKVKQINELLAKAEQKFQDGGEQAVAQGKAYTDEAIALSKTLSTVIDQSGNKVVSELEVQQQKISLITKAAQQYNAALADQKKAAEDGRDASIAAADAILPRLEAVRKEYTELAAIVEKGLAIKFKTDEEGIAKALAELDKALVEKEHLLKVKVDTEALQGQVAALVADLKKGVTEGADAQLQGIADQIQKITDEAPELNIKTDKAFEEIDKIRAAVDQIEQIRPELTIESNVADVQKDIDKLKEPTESTHTVHIVVDGALPGGTAAPGGGAGGFPGFALGGAVGGLKRRAAGARMAWQRYAAGGPVAPLPWLKVPGFGNADTVPARLEAGSFVLRKAAANFYGDLAMGRLAAAALPRRMASGGFFGDVRSGTTESVRTAGEIDAPTLPSDPKKRAEKILNYVFDVAAAAVSDDFFYWKSNLRLMSDAKQAYDFAPTDAHLATLLQWARTIGLNLGISHNDHTGFDVDDRRWHKQLARNLPAGLFGPLTYQYDFYAKGGPANTDTVNAMLTPGEFVVSAPATRAIGADLLHALNEIKIPRADLAEFVRLSAPGRAPARFAEGGMVAGAVMSPSSTASGGASSQWPGAVTFNLNASTQDLYSIDNVRRYLLPVLREIERRGK